MRDLGGTEKMIDWLLEGVEFGNCNCGWCLPCESDSGPSRGRCCGFEVIRVKRGHFGDIAFSGIDVALLYAWPGALFDGGGELQAIIDERATGAQRWALATILYGGETEEAKTHWWVFNAMAETMHPPLFREIDFEIDAAASTARVSIPGILEAKSEPIRTACFGSDHKVRIDVSRPLRSSARQSYGTTFDCSTVDLDLHGSFGQFGVLRHSGCGAVHRA